MSKAIENYIERELNNFRRKNEYDSSCINAFLDTKTYMQINKANERGIIEFCKRTKKEKKHKFLSGNKRLYCNSYKN